MPKPRLRLILMAASTSLLFAAGFTMPLRAQSSDTAPSVAEAAKRAREQKKNAAKPGRTITDDNLPKASPSDPVSVLGTQPAPPSDVQADAAAAASPADAGKAKQKKAEAAAALEKAKKELADAESELDVLQRKQALDDDAFHSKPDYEHDTAGRAQLDQEIIAVNDKKAAIRAMNEKIAVLQAQAGEAAPAPSPASEPNQNTPPN